MAMRGSNNGEGGGRPLGPVVVLGRNSLLRGGIASALWEAHDAVEQADALDEVNADLASALVVHVEASETLDAARFWRARRRKGGASAPLLIVDGASHPLDLRDLLPDGAIGVVHAGTRPDLIPTILTTIRAGLNTLDRTTTMTMLEGSHADASRPRDPRLDALSPREGDVLALLAQGLSDKAIARELGITDGTARVHVREILRKLDVSNRTQAALVYVSSGGADDHRPVS